MRSTPNWPDDWGSLPVAGGIRAAYRADLEQADDPAALLTEIRATRTRSCAAARPAGPRSACGPDTSRPARDPIAEYLTLVFGPTPEAHAEQINLYGLAGLMPDMP
jgi:hypothetical protein